MERATTIDLSGLLLREGGCFILVADEGGRVPLQLHRVPVDAVGKRVRVVGERRGAGPIDVEGVRLI